MVVEIFEVVVVEVVGVVVRSLGVLGLLVRAAGAGGPTIATGPGGARTGGAGAAGTGGAAAAAGAGAAGVSRAAGTGAAGGVGTGVSTDAGSSAGAGVGAVGAGGAAGAGAAAGGTGAVLAGSGGPTRPPYFVPLLEQVLGLLPSTGPAPPFECPQPVQSQSQLQPVSPLPAPSPYTGPTGGLAERRAPASRPASPVRTTRTTRRAPRPRRPAVPGTHQMALRLSTAPLRVPLPSPPESSLLVLANPESDSLRAASPAVTRLLANVVTDPSFESTSASALVAELVDFTAHCRLDYAASLGAESESVCPPSVGGECALSTDVLEDRQEEFQCFAAALPHLVSTLIASVGDPDAPDIPTPRSYAEAIEGPYSSQWQSAMDAEMASWKSTGTHVDEVPPPGANIVSGMWIFRVKRPPGSPPVFKARYVARGFSQRQGVDYFQTFSPTPKMTTLRVLLHAAAQRDYKLHSLDFSTAFLQGSLHEEIWLRRPPGFTGSFPPGTQWSLRRPVYGLRQAPREWHDTLRTTLAALGFAPSSADPSLFLRTDTSLPLFYILVYVDDLVFATAGLAHDRAQRTITLTQSHMVQQVLQRFDFTYSSPQATPLSTRHSLSALPSDESVEPSGLYPELVGCLMYLMTCTRPDLAYPISILARYFAPGRHRPEHMAAAKRVLRYLCSTSGMGLVLGGRRQVVLTGHTDASWADDQATQRSSQGYTFSLGSGSVLWRSTRSSSVLGSSCEAEIYAGAMAAQELRWLTYLLTDLGEPPLSPPVLYVDNKAMLALCREHRLEHRTKHIALCYFLARELQQRGQLHLAYVASEANTADIFTKALPPGDHQRFCTMLGFPTSAGVDYPEKIKCYNALSLLPESWGPLVVNLNGMKDSWSLEWIRAQVLQDEFRMKELTAAAGEGGGSAYGMKGFKGRGSKKGKAKEGSGGEQYSGGKRSNKGGKRCGGKCWYCHVEGHPWFKCRKLPDGCRPGQPSIEGSTGVHGAMGEGMGSEEGDGGDGGHGDMFYHGWLMWDPKSNTIFTTRDAKFMEGLMFKEWSERGRSKVTIPHGIEVGTNDPLLIPIELSSSSELTEVSHDLGGAEGEAADVEEVLQQGEAPVAERGDTKEEVQQPTPSSKLPPRRTTQGKCDAVRGGAKEGAAKERPKRASHPRDFLKYERLGVPNALLVQEGEDEEEKGAEGEIDEDEFQSHMENETWTLTNLPPGRKALDCMWELRVKTDAEGRLERLKTRLVIKGFQQSEGIDFQETAFLYGVVDEEIYTKQPEGYDDGSGRVCRLNKAIYGLKQAPRCWYARLVEALEALGFKVSRCDDSLFMTKGEEEKVFLLVYVDDILLFSPSLERIKEVQGKLKETFQCKALGPVGYYLGLHVERDEVKGWLRLHQHKYLAAMGEKYGLEEGRSVMTPLPSGFHLHLDEEEGEVLEYDLQRRFQSMAGSLMYASVNTRPDIAFSVSQLARVVSRPLQEHLDAAERLVSDASSHGGYICCVGGSPVSWKSKKQGEIAHSSTESEYMALFHGVKEVVWMKRLLEELGQEQEGPTPVFCDSQGAFAMAHNAVLRGLNKHMHIKWHWVRKEVKKGTISLHYINTTKQPADFLTKRLAEHQHWSCATLCGMSFN
ncbi:unnamed protein product [Closterium sp. NIES-54]